MSRIKNVLLTVVVVTMASEGAMAVGVSLRQRSVFANASLNAGVAGASTTATGVFNVNREQVNPDQHAIGRQNSNIIEMPTMLKIEGNGFADAFDVHTFQTTQSRSSLVVRFTPGLFGATYDLVNARLRESGGSTGFFQLFDLTASASLFNFVNTGSPLNDSGNLIAGHLYQFQAFGDAFANGTGGARGERDVPDREFTIWDLGRGNNGFKVTDNRRPPPGGNFIPEPTTAALGLLGVAGLMVRRRRAA